MNSMQSPNYDETESLLSQNGTSCKTQHVQYDSINCNAKNEELEESTSTSETTVTRIYWYRWYICGIFALLGTTQGAVWNTWSPIDESAECAIGFSSNDIDLLTNWGPIVFLVTMPFFMWMLDRKGLRLPIVITAFLVAAGTGLRCLPLPVHVLKYFIHLGQILNGAAGCVVMAAPTMLSNVWFPPSERVTATSISTLFNYMGTGVSYIIGPHMVQQPSGNSSHNQSLDLYHEYLKCNNTQENEIMRKEIMKYMYVEFGFSAAILLSILAFFPNKPPIPPSASASVERMDFKAGLLALRHRKTYIIVTLTFSLVIGSYGGWTGVMSVIMNPLGVSQDEAGMLGFYMTLVGCVIGMFAGWFADRFKGRMKLMIIILYSICFLSFLYYIVISQGWIHVKGFEFTQVGFWTVCIIIGITMNAVVPLAMEMGTDAAYPTSEAISTSVIVWCVNVFNFILIFGLQVSSDPAFTNYMMLAFIGLSIPLMIFFASEPMNRLGLDMHVEPSSSRKNDHKPLLDPNTNTDASAVAHSSQYGANSNC